MYGSADGHVTPWYVLRPASLRPIPSRGRGLQSKCGFPCLGDPHGAWAEGFGLETREIRTVEANWPAPNLEEDDGNLSCKTMCCSVWVNL